MADRMSSCARWPLFVFSFRCPFLPMIYGSHVVGPKGEHPVHGFFWYLEDYKAMIAVSGKDKIEELTFWTEKDFAKSKEHRSKSAKQITAFTIDPREKRVLIETNRPPAQQHH